MITPYQLLGMLFGVRNRQRDSEVLQLPVDSLAAVQGTYIYQRNTYRTLLKIALFQAVAILLLTLGGIWVVARARPEDRFFVSSVSGRIERVVPLDVPLLSNDQIYSYVVNDLAQAMTFGYLDYEQRKVQVGKQFEPSAFEKLQAALLGAGGVDEMLAQSRQFVTEINKSGAGGIVQQAINPDFTYEWIVSVPLTVKTTGSAQGMAPKQENWVVNVLAQRAAKIEVNRGYIIKRIVSAGPVVAGMP